MPASRPPLRPGIPDHQSQGKPMHLGVLVGCLAGRRLDPLVLRRAR
jgi:hypothetical protein